MTNPKSKFDNRFPHLVHLAIDNSATNKPGHSLVLTLRVSEAVYDLKVTRVRFGFRRFFLNFRLLGCEMPDEDWAIDPLVPQKHKLKTERHARVGTNKKTTRSHSLTASPTKADINARANQGSESSTYQDGEIRDEQLRTIAIVKARGGSSKPSWAITAPPLDTRIEGTIFKNRRFARLHPVSQSYSFSVDLEVPPDGLVIQCSDGAFKAYPNKRGFAKLLIRRSICSKPQELFSQGFCDAAARFNNR